jgi:predicted nucleic acid-binding protein
MPLELVYLDSVAVLAHFRQEAGRVDKCAGTLERAEAGDVCIFTSALTIAECLWLRGNPKIPKNRAEIVRRFFRRSFIRVRNVTRKTSEMAQDLVWDHGIHPKDAIHVATAIEGRVPVLETFDGGLIGKSGTRGLVIRKPFGPAQPRLPLG